jgi:lectin, mannose-binding 2
LGFSGETGELSDNHGVISVATKNLYDTKGRGDSGSRSSGGSMSGQNKGKPIKKETSGGSWSWFFFKVIAFRMLVGGSYVGYTAWRTQQRRAHRF